MTDIESLIDALLAAPVAKQQQRTVTVHRDADGRDEVEIDAHDVRIEAGGTLTLFDGDGATVAAFAPGQWFYVKSSDRAVAGRLRPVAWLRYRLLRGPESYRRLRGDAQAGGLDGGLQLSEAARLLGVQFLQCPDGPAWYLPPHSRSDAERLVRELMHGRRSELGEANRRRVMRDAIEILLGEN